MATLRLPFVALVSCVFAAASQAADFDGSKPFLCSLIEAHDCAPGTACIKGLAEDLKLPQFVRIDFQARTFAARGRTSPIRNAQRVDGQLIFQGFENGRAFSVTVGESSGRVVGAIAGDGEAFVVFGACTLVP